MIHSLVGKSGASIPDVAVDSFAAKLQGEAFSIGDPRYDASRRVFNGMIDRRPGLIVQPADARDVQLTVRFAREHDLLVSVKGGGHSAPGHAVCDGGVTVDLSRMKAIHVDPAARVARAESGATWGEFDEATQQHGLAVTGGRIRGTGIGGLTLGSGSGWLERKLGFTVDSLLGADVVLASGELAHASANDNPDLFWALRGGGGNYGIVTAFEYRLHQVGPMIYGGLLGFPREETSRVLRAYRDFMDRAPDDVGGAGALVTAPPEPFVPEPMRAKPIFAIIVCFTGNPEKGDEAFGPLLDLQPPLSLVQPMPYVMLQGLLDAANPPGMRNYWKADMYPELPDEAIDALAALTAEPLSPFTSVLVQPFGGQIARVADDATAMGWRGAKWSLHILGMWRDPREDASQIEWVRKVAGGLKPWAQKGTYLNYLMDEGEGRVRESFGPNYARMVALKNKYDPTNFFRLNQNIRPTGAAVSP